MADRWRGLRDQPVPERRPVHNAAAWNQQLPRCERTEALAAIKNNSAAAFIAFIYCCNCISRELFAHVNSGINFDKYEEIPVEATGRDAPPAIHTVTNKTIHTFLCCCCK